MSEKPSIDFQKMASEKSVIFVTTSPVKKSLHNLAQMFIAQAVKELFEFAEQRPDGVLPIPVQILDNCDSYVYLGGNNIDTARSISIRLNAPVDEVLHMPVGQVMVFRRGQQPVVTQRYDIFRDKDYQRITDAYEQWVQRRLGRERRSPDR